LPKDAYLRAKARQLAEMINAGIQPFQNTSTIKHVKHELKADEKAWTRRWLGAGLAALEASMAEVAGRFAVGDAVSVADVCLVPQMYAARRFEVDVTPFPTLLRVEAACSELSAFQAAHPDRQPDAPPPGA
jgi:maleylpyruvate isomerase